MRVIIFIALLLMVCTVQAQHQSLGLRVGDPSGVSYKKYLSNSAHAFEFVIGSVQPSWNQSYYKNSFDTYDKFTNDVYVDHRVKTTLYWQGRWLRQYPWHVEGVDGTFEWYWGVGALLKISAVDYDYRENGSNNVRTEKVNDLDIGPEIPLGMEYTFPDVPVTLFGEFGAFVELANRPGTLVIKGALGVRYNFY
jgi:hypothetical protein